MSWADALDQLEARLGAQSAVLDGRGQLPTAPLPQPDGPIPADMALRALALLDRCRQLEAQTAAALDRGHSRRR